MKIGIDIRGLMEQNYSGVSQYTSNLLENIFKQDNINQYLLFYNSSKKVTLPEFDYPNVKKIKFKYPNKVFNASQKFLDSPKIDKMLGEVDLFFMPNLLFTSLSDKVKKVLTIHDLSFERYPKFYTVKDRLWHKLVNPKKLCQKADSIIAVSENTKNDIINLYGIDENKIEVIYSGVSQNYHQVQENERLYQVKAKYNLPQKFALYLGNVEDRKNIESIIEATKDQNINLVIAGKGRTGKDRSLVKFIGYIEEDEKPSLYTLAHIFVYPSFYEGFGFPPLEAMFCGTPVICSSSSSLPEIVGDAAILVNPYDTRELSTAINSILNDKNLYRDLKSKGFVRARKFSWHKTAQKHLNIFQGL